MFRTADDMSVTLDLVSVNAYNEEVAALDIYSEEFSSLPPDVQHELLLERQLMEKHSHNDPDSLPQVRLLLAGPLATRKRKELF